MSQHIGKVMVSKIVASVTLNCSQLYAHLKHFFNVLSKLSHSN